MPQIVFFTFAICVGLKGGVFQSLVKLFYDVTVGFIMKGKSDIAMSYSDVTRRILNVLVS